MPDGYVPGQDVGQDADAGEAQPHTVIPQDSKQNLRKLRSKQSLAKLGKGISNAFNGIFTSGNRTVGFPYESFSDDPGARKVNGGIIFSNHRSNIGGSQSLERRKSTFGDLTRRMTLRSKRSGVLTQDTDVPVSPVDSHQQGQSPQDGPQSVPMERSMAQSGWRKLKTQISMPAIGSAVKRKRSENDLAQYGSASRDANIKVKRVTLAHPPRYTASEYTRSLENMNIGIAIGEPGPSNTRDRYVETQNQEAKTQNQDDEDVQMDQDAEPSSSQPTLDNFYELYGDAPPEQQHISAADATPRAMQVNEDALNALEGNAPHDDGSRWKLNRRHRTDDIARGLEILLGENVSRAEAMVVEMEEVDETETFSCEQKRTVSRFLLEAECPNGFEQHMEVDEMEE
ncbi:hypothetical protein PRZ48_014892 [Zasmidium cellare]|uniref:Uncharacterized protein n=1 Tax=Zasmidium cellare TaxID=395010 RepID=A0ABR0DX17_ZASCE|nr:hypothetical protein PRZ48_014892 [Zasmidium cellare]